MAEPVYRLAVAGDIEELVRLRILMQCELCKEDMASLDPRYAENIRSFFTAMLETDGYLGAVAEVGGRIVSNNGIIFYRKIPSLENINRGTKTGYVTNVYTVPEWRGKGIAKRLLGLLVAEAGKMNAGKLHLGSSELGMRLYQSAGFKTPEVPQFELLFGKG